jgi:hypothetical protein
VKYQTTAANLFDLSRMRILTYIGNVVTGRFAHWNSANNDTIVDLWERCNEFPEAIKIAFQEFIASSSSLMDVLLGPDRGRKRLVNKDPLRITRKQFARMHAVILECLAGVFIKLNPYCSESFKGALAILTGRNPDRSRIIQLIDGMDKPDLMTIGCAAWEKIIAIAESPQDTDALGAYPFAALLGSLGARSFKEINNKLPAIHCDKSTRNV